MALCRYAQAFLWLQRAGATLRCGVQASHCGGFSCRGAWALGTWASVVVAHGFSSCGSRALECRLSSCGTWALLLCGMWDPPRPGLEPMSPALAGGLPTTAPPDLSSNSQRLPSAVSFFLCNFYSEQLISIFILLICRSPILVLFQICLVNFDNLCSYSWF